MGITHEPFVFDVYKAVDREIKGPLREDSDQIDLGYTAPLNFLVKPVTDGVGATLCYVCQPVPKVSQRYNNGNSKYSVIGILLNTVA